MSRFKTVKPEGMDDFINEPSKKNEPIVHSNTATNTIVGMNASINIDINIKLNIDVNAQQIAVSANPKSIKRKLFNVKLNEYYLQILEQLANREEGISMQYIAGEIVERGLDAILKQKEKQ